MTLADLESLRQEWLAELSRAAEGWMAARARGDPTDEFDQRMRRADRESRKVERRIRRRKQKGRLVGP